MLSTESIELALAKSNLPNHIKLFFLGISGKKVMKVCRRRIISKSTPQPRVYEKKRDIAENDMQSRLNEWICIDENISKDFSIENLAEQLKTSRRSLERFLHSSTNQDFRYWKTSIRIERAKTLLLEREDATVIEIAMAVGFNDKSNFHKKFKEITGCTPAQWRECGGHPDVVE